MKRLIAAAIIATGTYAQAQDASQCTVIADETERLGCFDAAYRIAPKSETQNFDNWNVRTVKSDFTDETDAYIHTESQNTISCGVKPKTPLLFVRCKEGVTNYFIAHQCFAPSPSGDRYDRLPIELRIDDSPAETQSPNVDASDKAFGYFGDGTAKSYIKSDLIGRQKLLVRFTPYKDSPKTMKFDISNLREAMLSANPSCDWSAILGG